MLASLHLHRLLHGGKVCWLSMVSIVDWVAWGRQREGEHERVGGEHSWGGGQESEVVLARDS